MLRTVLESLAALHALIVAIGIRTHTGSLPKKRVVKKLQRRQKHPAVCHNCTCCRWPKLSIALSERLSMFLGARDYEFPSLKCKMGVEVYSLAEFPNRPQSSTLPCYTFAAMACARHQWVKNSNIDVKDLPQTYQSPGSQGVFEYRLLAVIPDGIVGHHSNRNHHGKGRSQD